MTRTFVKIAVIASLASCALTASRWARSYYVEQSVGCVWVREPAVHTLSTDVSIYRGVVMVTGRSEWYVPRNDRNTLQAGLHGYIDNSPLAAPDGHGRTGLFHFAARWSGPRVGRNFGFDAIAQWRFNLTVPLWVPTLAFAAGPAGWWRSRRRRVETARRAAAGECVACGYDLRGGQSSCPECGAIA